MLLFEISIYIVRTKIKLINTVEFLVFKYLI